MLDYSRITFVDDKKLNLRGKRVLVRADFNVPLSDSGQITNDKRIRESLPTIRLLIERGARVILMSHLGRPKGGPEPKYSLAPVAADLAQKLGTTVPLLDDCVGEHVVAATKSLADGQVLMLENVRFHKAEEKDGAAFGRLLAPNGDLFVNDAFGTCHRAHGSVSGVPALLPHAAGLLVKKEVEAFAPLMTNPPRPYVAVLGGAKVSDKIKVIESLLARVDTIIIGGAMAYTFLKARGELVGKSLVEDGHTGFALGLLERAKERGVKILLPVDHVVSGAIDDEAGAKTTALIPENSAGFDIGPATAKQYAAALASARAVIFNGPMGVFERPAFASGTKAVLDGLAAAHKTGALVVVGGGDSAAACEQFGYEDRVTHVSTGGGASLELLEGLDLPGLAALVD